MTSIKNIIFDYGNVIFLIDFKRTQHSFTGLGIENVDRFFAHAGHDPLFDEFEKGNISSAEFRDGIRRITGKPELTDERIDNAWTSLLIGVPRVNHELVLKCKHRYRTFLLSNINEIHLNYITGYLQQEYHITSNDVLFEKVYYSHLVRLRKPDPAIFNLVIQENGLDPAETLFIDDSPQHLKAAVGLGLHTHLVTAEDSLEKFLYRSGLLEQEP
ncbi:HAD family hydrolase [Hufsiella ginkgonis]|uniref:HAD-IA family hydrolase n=1 Tax=Hufsiella ginkgonis TaxID=2695274 RepID=A0A7K1Y3X3_9SPHI|nr:HAD family phosphatase [Hufsiella ginkgonis]MXV17759.1 HAD-IA family hydrolase [Hufsiella ginkgonis]